jgi:cysteine-rich repeat protein
MRRRILAAGLAWIACGESSGTPSMDGTGSTTASEDTAVPSTSGSSAETSAVADSTGDVVTTTGSESSSGTTSTFPIPVCGDGIVEGDEECDDQNRDPHDGCDGLCNLSGIVEWTVVFDGPDSGNDVAQAMAVAPGGDLWVAGTIGGVQQAVRLRRYDPSGRFVAEIDLASETSDDVRGLAIDDQGALYVAGSSLGLGVDEAWMVKLDSAGSEEWRYSRVASADTASVAARDVALGPSAIYMVGIEERTTKAVDLDAWVVALDAEGMPQWEHPYPGEPGEDAFAGGVAVAPDGTIVVVGVESRPGQHLDGWVRKLDPAGTTQWTVTEIGAGVASEETLRAVAIAGDGGIVVTGLLDALEGELLFTREYAPSGGAS